MNTSRTTSVYNVIAHKKKIKIVSTNLLKMQIVQCINHSNMFYDAVKFMQVFLFIQLITHEEVGSYR